MSEFLITGYFLWITEARLDGKVRISRVKSLEVEVVSHLSNHKICYDQSLGSLREKVNQELAFYDASVSPLLPGLPARENTRGGNGIK